MTDRPDWLDERIRLGEVPEHARAEAERRSRAPERTGIEAELTESDKEILAALPPARFAAEVERRRAAAARIESAKASARTFRAPRAAWGGAAMAAGLALFFAFVPRPAPRAVDESPVPSTARQIPSSSPTSSAPTPPAVPAAIARSAPAPATAPAADPSWRAKGGVDLAIRRETAGGLDQAVTETDTLPAGTRLRLSVPAALAWAAVFSVDSRGEIAQHWPLSGDRAEPLPAGPLPRVWELDDATGRETFVLVWGTGAFDLAPVRKAILRNPSAPGLPEGLQRISRFVPRPGDPNR